MSVMRAPVHSSLANRGCYDVYGTSYYYLLRDMLFHIIRNKTSQLRLPPHQHHLMTDIPFVYWDIVVANVRYSLYDICAESLVFSPP